MSGGTCDEVFVSIAGKRMYLWRAVDSEGEVLDILVQSRRNKNSALKVIRKLLKKQGFVPDTVRDRHTAILWCCSEGFGPYQAP